MCTFCVKCNKTQVVSSGWTRESDSRFATNNIDIAIYDILKSGLHCRDISAKLEKSYPTLTLPLVNGSDSKGGRVVRHVADATNTKGRQAGQQGRTQREAKGNRETLKRWQQNKETLTEKQRNASVHSDGTGDSQSRLTANTF